MKLKEDISREKSVKQKSVLEKINEIYKLLAKLTKKTIEMIKIINFRNRREVVTIDSINTERIIKNNCLPTNWITDEFLERPTIKT